MTRGMEPEQAEPGLRSVARATARPESIMARAFACPSPRQKESRGRQVATTPAPASREVVLDALSRWSALVAPSSAARAAPPVRSHLLGMELEPEAEGPCGGEEAAAVLDAEGPSSQKASQKRAMPWAATAGRTSETT